MKTPEATRMQLLVITLTLVVLLAQLHPTHNIVDRREVDSSPPATLMITQYAVARVHKYTYDSRKDLLEVCERHGLDVHYGRICYSYDGVVCNIHEIGTILRARAIYHCFHNKTQVVRNDEL